MSASSEELRLGEERETWCTVERMKEEAWCRKQRGHINRYKNEMDSDVFRVRCDPHEEAKQAPRCSFGPDKPTHLEQRHYPKAANSSQLSNI